MVFFVDLLVKPISLSKNPPFHGASSRLKVHPTCRFAKYSFTVGSFNVSRIMHLADLNVLALSEISSFGRPLLETNLLKHLINDLAESSVTTSKCTARTTAQVNRQIQCLLSESFKYSGPAKSMLVNVNGGSSDTLHQSGRAGAEGDWYGGHSIF